MGKCAVKACTSRSQTNNKASGVTFHKLPKDHKRREKWIENIRLLRKETDWLPSTYTVICSKHFQNRDMILPKLIKGNVRLSNEAIPIIIDENESPVEVDVSLNVDTDEEMLEIIETPRKHKMRNTIKRLQFLSSKRLKCLKNLRAKNKRLEKRNKKLSDLIKETLLM